MLLWLGECRDSPVLLHPAAICFLPGNGNVPLKSQPPCIPSPGVSAAGADPRPLAPEAAGSKLRVMLPWLRRLARGRCCGQSHWGLGKSGQLASATLRLWHAVRSAAAEDSCFRGRGSLSEDGSHSEEEGPEAGEKADSGAIPWVPGSSRA